MKNINAFILAAGLGERLRPITNHIPKPLLPVLGRPVMELVLERISSLPVDRIGINTHYKKEAIEDWARRSALKGRIELFHEEKILGTGGALKNAEGLLGERTFMAHNSDILTDIDLGELLSKHDSSGNLVTLAAHDFPRFNCLDVDAQGLLKGVRTGAAAPRAHGRLLAFTGIAVYGPRFLDYLPAGNSSVVDAWLAAAADGRRVGIYEAVGHRWSDIGTPAAYASAVFERLREEGEILYINGSVKIERIDVQGYAVIEDGSEVNGGVTLKDCIIMPGTTVGDGSRKADIPPDKNGRESKLLLEELIIGPDFNIRLNRQDVAALYGDGGEQLVGAGGSDRRYYRVYKDGAPVVLMRCAKDDPDFTRHIEYTRFFRKHGIAVPALISSDADRAEASFEDGGDVSLYTWLRCGRDDDEVESLYRNVMDVLAAIHTKATDEVSTCPLLGERIFDFDHFRWETNYFLDNFVRTICKAAVPDPASLDKELDALARKADRFAKTVIHRDFQSQNILVVRNEKVLIIDFQGARMGPPAYDLASILRDPYHRLGDAMRQRLEEHYVSRMRTADPAFDEASFMESLPVCRLQRHMQALGAFGFLSAVKGKRHFLKHAAEGLRLLKEDVKLVCNSYPLLYELVSKLDEPNSFAT